ncbi:hypothetical protein OYC64_010050 [Pagothenia borchgrevinki]|uniref:Fibrinogen C-terminal domain-containing protein n=1 Tax=Pagothenia borchgrevinki TaxID=8213 RepID=A0ABD2H6S1_PAGBO
MCEGDDVRASSSGPEFIGEKQQLISDVFNINKTGDDVRASSSGPEFIGEKQQLISDVFNINKTGRQSGHTAGRSPSDHCSRNMTMKLVSVGLVLLALLFDRGMSHGSVLPMDCSDYHNRPSGVYPIYPVGSNSAVQVYCDMDSLGGRWTVFQRRMDGSVNFYRPWYDYKTGFGNAAGECWLGLDTLSHLTLRKNYELLVDMEDFDGNKVFARYSSFSVHSESYGFTLHVSGFTDGGAGDSLSYHNGQKFSTYDKDQDSSTVNCATYYTGGFWYNDCHRTNPNGVYRLQGNTDNGVIWSTWQGYSCSLKSISMKIRPV